MDAKVSNSEQTTNGKYRESKKWKGHQSLSAALTTVALGRVSVNHDLFGSKQFLVDGVGRSRSWALR